MPSFSVCMSVYRNDEPRAFIASVRSIYKQTLPPSEIIIVVDGPIPLSLEEAISLIVEEIPLIKLIRLKDNMGHAFARQTALEAAENELCAVMDADDLSVPNRFEKQIKAFNAHPDVSVVGGLINEFINSIDNVVGTRIVPEKDHEIKEYLKYRCPMNLVTVMLKKSDVLNVGGYQDWYCEEDYYLWIRLFLKGYSFYNIQENLVNVRVGADMYRRRGGIKYFKSEKELQKYMFDRHVINYYQYLTNVLKRLIVQVFLPNSIRGWVFQVFARQ